MSKYQKNIPKIMNLLTKHFDYKERTTLNRMRAKPNPFKILISCLLSLRTQDKNTEKASSRLFA
ncbi:MAG: endonuclease III, partial [archaeon]